MKVYNKRKVTGPENRFPKEVQLQPRMEGRLVVNWQKWEKKVFQM